MLDPVQVPAEAAVEAGAEATAGSAAVAAVSKLLLHALKDALKSCWCLVQLLAQNDLLKAQLDVLTWGNRAKAVSQLSYSVNT